jgi:hypothetical protein
MEPLILTTNWHLTCNGRMIMTIQTEKCANEKTTKSSQAGKNKETCGGDKVVGFDGEGQPQKADEIVRMGRVVAHKKTSGCDS